MVDDSNILMHFGGVDRNSLIRILNQNDEDQSIFYNEPSIIKNSPYYNDEKLIHELNTKTNNFNILSLNCESINSKFDQINITIEQFKRNGCIFSAICLQESWLTYDTDTSLFQLDGYNLIAQGKRCSTRGGLIIYLKDTIQYKLIDIQANSNIWEGQFIEIEHENVGNKKIILGNVYRPPHDINENYNQLINEFVPILSEFGKSKSDVIIAGDYNIDLLKVLAKPVFSVYFDAVTALNFFPKITLPTRFSERSCTLIDNFLCKCSHLLSESIAGILFKQISDHLPYFISMNNVNIKHNNTKRIIKIKQQNESNVAKFKAELSHAYLYSKLDLRKDADPNINYDILELTITDAANKHLPTKNH